MDDQRFIQTHNQYYLERLESLGPASMGVYLSETWRNDPKHVLFSMARYKFCSKMLTGKKNAIEIGCGDGTCLPLILQTVEHVHGVDLEPIMVEMNKERFQHLKDRLSFEACNVAETTLSGSYDCAYSLDVIEHIEPEREADFMKNLLGVLTPHAMCIIGTPNISSDQYASQNSKEGHINLKSGDSLRELLLQYFHNVILFSMNDEVVHTGFSPMAHFLIGVGIGIKSPA